MRDGRLVVLSAKTGDAARFMVVSHGHLKQGGDAVESPADSTWKGYSLAERDRRWAAVRQNAAEAGFDCVFVPVGNGSDARYLTQLGAASVVLPTDGRPPIVVSDRGG